MDIEHIVLYKKPYCNRVYSKQVHAYYLIHTIYSFMQKIKNKIIWTFLTYSCYIILHIMYSYQPQLEALKLTYILIYMVSISLSLSLFTLFFYKLKVAVDSPWTPFVRCFTLRLGLVDLQDISVKVSFELRDPSYLNLKMYQKILQEWFPLRSPRPRGGGLFVGNLNDVRGSLWN